MNRFRVNFKTIDFGPKNERTSENLMNRFKNKMKRG